MAYRARIRRRHRGVYGLGNVDTSGLIDNGDGTYTDPATGIDYSSGGHPLDPNTGLPIVPSSGTPNVAGAYVDASGNTIIPLQGGGYRSISPSGNMTQFDTAPPAKSTSIAPAVAAATIQSALQFAAMPTFTVPGTQSFSQWFQANQTMVLIGGGAFLFLILAMGRR